MLLNARPYFFTTHGFVEGQSKACFSKFMTLSPCYTTNKQPIPLQTRSPPPSNTYTSMCPTTSSPQMPLPPPLTFNSTKNKPKQSALVSPVNGAPSVTPYTGQSQQNCQVQSQQQRNREVIVLSLLLERHCGYLIE